MAVIAKNQVTVSSIRDIASTGKFYKLQSSTSARPSKPTSISTLPPSGWTDVEPSYTTGSTNTLYTVELTVFTDGTFNYTDVMTDSSYEAAKAAYNEAQNAKRVAVNFLSADASGIMVADMSEDAEQTPSAPTGRNVLIDNDSVDIRDGEEVLASFGNTVVIGDAEKMRVEQSFNSWAMYDIDGTESFAIRDRRNADGTYTQTRVQPNVQGEGIYNLIYLDLDASSVVSITFNGVEKTSGWTFDNSESTNNYVFFDEIPPKGTVIAITYVPNGKAIGVTQGSGNTALMNAYAHGQNNRARGSHSRAYGYNTYTQGLYSLAGGRASSAYGNHSWAVGNGVKTMAAYQYAFGQYNDINYDNPSEDVFMVGNGTGDANTKNAFAVKKTGDVEIQRYILDADGNLKMCAGSVSITPTAANARTSKNVTFPMGFAGSPVIVVSPVTAYPKAVYAGFDSVSTTGFRCWLQRDSTAATTINWIAMAK